MLCWYSEINTILSTSLFNLLHKFINVRQIIMRTIYYYIFFAGNFDSECVVIHRRFELRSGESSRRRCTKETVSCLNQRQNDTWGQMYWSGKVGMRGKQ